MNLGRKIAMGALTAVLTLSVGAHLPPSYAEPTGAATESAAKPTGRVKLVVRTPRGVPATVVLARGKDRRVVTKAPRGKVRRATVKAAPGKVRVSGKDVIHAGRTYRAKVSTKAVRVKARRTTKVIVRYRKLAMAADVRVTKVDNTTITVGWSKAPRGTRVVVRRTAGTVAPARPGQGTKVAVKAKKRTARATKLRTGQAYAFTVFTMKGRKVVGSQSAQATPFTPDSPGGGYSAPSTSIIHTDPATSPRAYVRSGAVVLPLSGGAVPQVGAGVVLPPTTLLPHGFVGTVAGIDADGRGAVLRPDAVDKVFDVVIGRGEFDGERVQLEIDDEAGDEVVVPQEVAPLAGDGRTTPQSAGKVLKKCVLGNISDSSNTADLVPSFAPTGWFEPSVVTKSIFTKKVPYGMELKSGFDLRPSIKVDMNTKGAVSCAVPIKRFVKPFSAGPIPMVLNVTPTIEIGVDGAVTFRNVGFNGNLGYGMHAKYTLTSGLSVKGERILDATPLTPDFEKVNYKARVTVGVKASVGPGSGSEHVGGLVGGYVNFKAFEATLGPKWPSNDMRHLKCLAFTAKTSFSGGLEAKAWLSKFEVGKEWEFGEAAHYWFGGTQHFPEDCQHLEGPSDDVIGDDVTQVEEEIEGDDGQWGRDDVFSPGQDSWILSTGLMSDLDNESSFFASTDLMRMGNERLTELSGWDTYDAVSYRTTVVPHRDRLHIRYLFASEEYPDYVGSRYNDVMAVYVDGVNCATVDGVPVSVNAINEQTNSHLFVPNYPVYDEGDPEWPGDPTLLLQKPQTAGDLIRTAMNGFTVPLQCTMPVTPGEPVEIEITVADTSDGIYDSAVALLDGGIWSS